MKSVLAFIVSVPHVRIINFQEKLHILLGLLVEVLFLDTLLV